MFKVKMDNIVIDVIGDPVWVSYQQKNDLFLRTTEQYATGVVASDGSTIFYLNDIILIEITDEEALELQAILEANEQELIEQLQEELGVDEVPEEQILPRVPLMELQAMVQVLVDKVDKLEDENSRLKEIIEAGGHLKPSSLGAL